MNDRVRDLEDTVLDLRDEVRDLRAEVRGLRRELRHLGGEVASSQASEADRGQSQTSLRDSRESVRSGGEADTLGSFSLVRPFNEDASRSRSGSGYPSRGGASSPTPSATSAAGSQTSGLSRVDRRLLSWEQREAICEEIGQYIRRALAGGHRGASGRDKIVLPSRLWLVFRDYEGLEYRPVLVCHSFSECKNHVKRGEDCGESVFIGLPSEREGRRVAGVAGVPWPSSLQQ